MNSNVNAVLIWTIAEVFLTAYQALVTNAAMKDGETVLIHAVCLLRFQSTCSYVVPEA